MTNAVFWFSNDLRLEDNAALNLATAEKTLAFIYCIDPNWFVEKANNCKPLGKYRYRFLLDSLQQLDQKLSHYGQHLNVFFQRPIELAKYLYQKHDVRRFYHSVNAGLNERRWFETLSNSADDIQLISSHSHTLFEPQDLPFNLEGLPVSFSKFRTQIEKNNISPRTICPAPQSLPISFLKQNFNPKDLPVCDVNNLEHFNGGITTAKQHCEHYFKQPHPQTYKQTRNALDDWSSSTKFSPWLAIGCISPRQVMHHLQKHETIYGANDSTYWIYFELLWREYFQWYAHAHDVKLFRFKGITNKKPMTSFYSERFNRWCSGNTAFPLVNACMKQLNTTGFMSNRGRQIVASCLIHELKLDWRYGAAYFEQQLIDYDVASNWGNWQYLAGVGADTRGSRRFNIQKQTEMYDPEGIFIEKWNGEQIAGNGHDSVDAADWPIA